MSSHHFYILVFVLAMISTMVGITTVVPSLRQAAKEKILDQDRRILAKAEGDLTGRKDHMVVVKVQTSDSLSIEVFAHSPENSELVFQKRLILPERRDGYFTFRGQDTNLVLADIDKDGGFEILAPTFDENLIPRLNVYKYDPETQSFTRLGSDSLKL